MYANKFPLWVANLWSNNKFIESYAPQTNTDSTVDTDGACLLNFIDCRLLSWNVDAFKTTSATTTATLSTTAQTNKK